MFLSENFHYNYMKSPELYVCVCYFFHFELRKVLLEKKTLKNREFRENFFNIERKTSWLGHHNKNDDGGLFFINTLLIFLSHLNIWKSVGSAIYVYFTFFLFFSDFVSILTLTFKLLWMNCCFFTSLKCKYNKKKCY